jgi:uncharacterized protein (TIGR03118 family)
MSLLFQPRRRFWASRAAPDRPRPYRPVLEYLEGRHLPSAGVAQFAQVNLASDVPGWASVTDPNLINPWGIAFSPTGPFWFADNGWGVSDVLDGRGQPLPLVVGVPPTTPSGGTPTGLVFNGGRGFVVSENGVSAPSRFLFATEDGTISGWSALVDPSRAVLAVDNSSAGAVYKGLALAVDTAGQSLLYAADFGRGRIDVFDQDFQPVVRLGSFQDPNLPNGFAPFNIQDINNLLFVTYAQQDAARHDDVPGAGHGFIDVYDTGGKLLRRFASEGALNSPWGLALAPADFGPFGGAVLVGNNGDGHINAYDPGSGTFLGELADDRGMPIAIAHLWALRFGNGHAGGDADTLFFAAGLDDETHGLFGAIQAPQRQGRDTAGPLPFDSHAPGEPGDYPLPPSSGPALQESDKNSPVATAILLPLTESSLALVPTLSTVPPPRVQLEPPVAVVPMGGFSLGESVATTVPVSSTLLPNPTAAHLQSAKDAHTGAVALNSFLDLNGSPDVLPERAEGQHPGFHLHAVAERSSSADGAAGDEDLVEAYVATLETQASEEQGPEKLPPKAQAHEVIAEIHSTRRPESAGERTLGNESVPTQDGGGWTHLLKVFAVIGIPRVLWLGRLLFCQGFGLLRFMMPNFTLSKSRLRV